MIANFVSFFVGGKELWITGKVWVWTKNNLRHNQDMYKIALRNVRAALLKFLLAVAFVLAGLSLFVAGTGTIRIWLLVIGAIILSVDIVWEARYRGSMFESARRRAEAARVSAASSDDE